MHLNPRNSRPNLVSLVTVLLALAIPVQAQSDYILGTTVNLTAGGTRQSQPSSSQAAGASQSSAFYGLYPALSLTSMRQSSSLAANYAFGYIRTTGRASQSPESHNASLNFSKTLGPRWSTTLFDTFSWTADPNTFNLLSGGASTPQDASSIFSPTGTGRSRLTNDINGSLTWALDQSSDLTFNAAHRLLEYGASAGSNGLLANQQRFSGGLTFNQTLGRGESWNLSYRSFYFDSDSSTDSLSQSAQAGYSVQVTPNTTVVISAGLSQVTNQGAPGGYRGYDATASVTKTINADSISLSYNQNSHDSIGVGSTSITRRGALSWNRAFGNIMTAAADASAYYSTGTLNNTLNVRGVTASANVGFPLTRTLSVAGGVTFQSTRGTVTFDFTQERAFISLNYSQPNLRIFR